MTNKKYYKKNLFFTERYYFKGAYIYIGCYLGLILVVVLYFLFINWLYGMNQIIQHQLHVCLVWGICLMAPIPALIYYGNRKYWKNPPISPNWQKYEGEITAVLTGSFSSIYNVTVSINGQDRIFTIELDKKVIDPDLALVYAREDNKINVMVNLNNINEGKILAEEYFRRQEARKLPRIRLNDGSYKYNELHEVGESQKIVVGELNRNMTKHRSFTSHVRASDVLKGRTPHYICTIDAVISCYEKENKREFQFKCSVFVPKRILVAYINRSMTSIPVEVIVDKLDYSKYTVLLNKALEETFGTEMAEGWLNTKIL